MKKKKFKKDLKELLECLLVLLSPVIIFTILGLLGIEI
jgi:hypothetical protein